MQTKSPFKPGFRINSVDVIFLLLGIIMSLCVSMIGIEYSILFILPFIAFFLFCNVFRIRRKPELIWAFIYTITSIIWFVLQSNFAYYIANTIIWLVVVITWEIKQPGYHGVLWEKINPNLQIWFDNNMKSAQHGDAPEPATNAISALQPSVPPAR